MSSDDDLNDDSDVMKPNTEHCDKSMQMLLSYHRRLRMISVALELRKEGGRVSHS